MPARVAARREHHTRRGLCSNPWASAPVSASAISNRPAPLPKSAAFSPGRSARREMICGIYARFVGTKSGPRASQTSITTLPTAINEKKITDIASSNRFMVAYSLHETNIGHAVFGCAKESVHHMLKVSGSMKRSVKRRAVGSGDVVCISCGKLFPYLPAARRGEVPAKHHIWKSRKNRDQCTHIFPLRVRRLSVRCPSEVRGADSVGLFVVLKLRNKQHLVHTLIVRFLPRNCFGSATVVLRLESCGEAREQRDAEHLPVQALRGESRFGQSLHGRELAD